MIRGYLARKAAQFWAWNEASVASCYGDDETVEEYADRILPLTAEVVGPCGAACVDPAHHSPALRVVR